MARQFEIVPSQLPVGICVETLQQQLNLFAQYSMVQINEFSNFVIAQSTEPGPDFNEYIWLRLDSSGLPIWIYKYYSGTWVPMAGAPIFWGSVEPIDTSSVWIKTLSSTDNTIVGIFSYVNGVWVNSFTQSPDVFNARLTLQSGVAVPTSDVTGSQVYLTPYEGNVITLFEDLVWRAYTFSEVSASAGALLANTNYDVFVFTTSGVLELEFVAWTGATTRATALSLQNGVYVQTGAANKRYCGTIRTTSSIGQVTDSATQGFLWNFYNQVPRKRIKVVNVSAGATWSHSGSTWRQSNGDTANRVEVVVGLQQNITGAYSLRGNPDGSGRTCGCGLAVDSTSSPSDDAHGVSVPSASGTYFSLPVDLYATLTEGYHAINGLEYASGGTVTFGALGPTPNGSSIRVLGFA